MKKYLCIAKISLLNALQYRGQMLARLCFYALFIFTYFYLWGAVYRDGHPAGYSHVQMVWYLIVTEMVLFCRPANTSRINEEIKSGAIAYQLSRPVHYIALQGAETLGQLAVTLLFFGTAALALGLIFVGPLPHIALAGLAVACLSFLLGVMLQFFLTVAIALTAFSLVDNSGIFLIFSKLTFMLGALLPVEFLPPALQPLAEFLPFPYIAWAPAKMLVDAPLSPLPLLGMQALWCLIAFGLCMAGYRAGIHRLQMNGG